MKPYYEHAGIRIYHADCRDVLPTLEKSDLLLTDPPYGLRWEKLSLHDKQDKRPKWEDADKWDVRPDPDTLRLCIARARRYVIWGGNYFADVLGPCAGVLVWNKLTGANPFADGELAWSTIAGTCRIFTHQWCGAFKASERGAAAMHPTQKPVALMTWCISLANYPASIVDPFVGTGTTLVAAKQLGIPAVGIDANERYCEIAAMRLAQEVMDFGADL